MFFRLKHIFSYLSHNSMTRVSSAIVVGIRPALIGIASVAGVFSALLFSAALLSAAPAYAYDDRVALVIGNDAYPTSPLKNAQNDARAVAKTLSDLGFKVVVKTNADTVTMRSAAVEFTKVLDGARAAVFYYAGHGIQYRDKNFMVPTDAKFTSEAEIVYNAVDVGQILESMDDAKVPFKFVILDACRDNPFSNVFATTGLAKISKVPQGTIVAYGAAAGAIALDGDGINGLYTKHLLAEIRNPDYQAGFMFQRVQTAVAQESNNKQLPELYSTPLPRGAFFFAEKSAHTNSQANANAQTTAQAGALAGTSSGVSNDAQAANDREFWASIKESKNIGDFQAYLETFPAGTFARLARNRMDGLKQQPQQQPQPPQAVQPVVQPSTPVLTASAPSANKPTHPSGVADVPDSRAELSAEKTKPAAVLVAIAETVSKPAALAMPSAAKSIGESRGIDPTAAAPVSVQPQPTATTSAPIVKAKLVEPVLVASIATEQKTSLPAVPSVPKTLAGLIDFPDGAKYNGEYKEDKDRTKILHGRGEYKSALFRYQGEFKEGKKQGRGLYEWANGDRFDGDFADDSPNGRGVWTFATGDKYEGEVKNSAVIGKGIFTTKNGDKIDGTFIDAKQMAALFMRLPMAINMRAICYKAA